MTRTPGAHHHLTTAALMAGMVSRERYEVLQAEVEESLTDISDEATPESVRALKAMLRNCWLNERRQQQEGKERALIDALNRAGDRIDELEATIRTLARLSGRIPGPGGE